MRRGVNSDVFAGKLHCAIGLSLFGGLLLLAACPNTDDATEMSDAASDDSPSQSDKEDSTPTDFTDGENSESSAEDTESSMSKSDEETLEVPECPPNEESDALDGMAYIFGGVFAMGSKDGREDARVVRNICLRTFHIDFTEVSVRAYQSCVDAGACDVEGLDYLPLHCNWGREDKLDHPLNCVSWLQAENYCRWTGKRLPTEAEWERAARGKNSRTYPWGETPPSCELAVMSEDDPQALSGCDTGGTWPVTRNPAFPPNGTSSEGAMDLVGNVSEWVADWYAEVYDKHELVNPQGPGEGMYKVYRGGGFTSSLVVNLVAYQRRILLPDRRDVTLGFRCAKDAVPNERGDL